MAKTRYANTDIIDDFRYATWKVPVKSAGYKEINYLDNVRTFEYVIKVGDRPDHLASRFYGDEAYWWVVCLANGINYPFASGGWIIGRVIKLPFEIKDVLDKIMP